MARAPPVPAPVPFETRQYLPDLRQGHGRRNASCRQLERSNAANFSLPGRSRRRKVGAGGATKGKTIGDQLVRAGLSWKSYQEDLPITGADLVNYSNGTASNLTNFTPLAPLTSSGVVQAYAVKHNPFAYFKSVQEGTEFGNSLDNIVGFEGPRGLVCRPGERRCSVPGFHRAEPMQ